MKKRSDLPSLAYTSRFMPPPKAPRSPSEKPGRSFKPSHWVIEAIARWPLVDITAAAMAAMTGRTEKQCAKQLTCALTNGMVRRVKVSESGRLARIWERTKAKPKGTVHAHVERIVAMAPGTRFIAPDLELPDSSRSRAIRLARDAGLIRSVGVEKPKWATYRRVDNPPLSAT